jgi:hypothetical protein
VIFQRPRFCPSVFPYISVAAFSTGYAYHIFFLLFYIIEKKYYKSRKNHYPFLNSIFNYNSCKEKYPPDLFQTSTPCPQQNLKLLSASLGLSCCLL